MDLGCSVRFVPMRISYQNSRFLVLIILAQAVVFTSTQEQPCDPRCLTKSCDAAGNCRCVAAATDGPTYFLGGEFCDQPSHYCRGSSDPSFWCVVNELNNTCGTGADNNPLCICHLGFTGKHCEIAGTPCGVGYCYNNATCLEGGRCDCPLGWRGNANCSLASPEDESSSGSSIKWWGVLLITGAVVAVLSVAVVFGMKMYKERMEGVNRFNELKKSQTRGRAESDDDEYDSDPYEDEAAKRPTTTTAQI